MIGSSHSQKQLLYFPVPRSHLFLFFVWDKVRSFYCTRTMKKKKPTCENIVVFQTLLIWFLLFLVRFVSPHDIVALSIPLFICQINSSSTLLVTQVRISTVPQKQTQSLIAPPCGSYMNRGQAIFRSYWKVGKEFVLKKKESLGVCPPQF